MTAYHAFNCVALAFGPYALLWYLINEDNILSLVIWSGLFYAVTQIIVILLLATFLTEPEVDNDFVVLHELGRTLISVVNIGAIYMALITKQARITARHLRILGVGFGWATANCLLSVAGPLIYSAGSNEFNWENPMKASKFCSDCGVPFVCNLLCFKTREYNFLTRFVFFIYVFPANCTVGCTVTLLSTLATVGFVEKSKKDRFNVVSIAFIVVLTCQSSLNVYLNSLNGVEQIYVVVGNILFGWVACYFAGVKLNE